MNTSTNEITTTARSAGLHRTWRLPSMFLAGAVTLTLIGNAGLVGSVQAQGFVEDPGQRAEFDLAAPASKHRVQPLRKAHIGEAIAVTPEGQVFTYRLSRKERATILQNQAPNAPGEEAAATRGGNESAHAPVAQLIKGTDDRELITDTTATPWRQIGLIGIKTGSGYGACTGTLIGPRHVLTAGHCVYDTETNSWASDLAFVPAASGSSRPYGIYGWSRAIAPSKWVKEHNPRFDYAIIVLASSPGNSLGWHGYGYTDNATFASFELNLAGYPEDGSLNLYYSACEPGVLRPAFVLHQCDTLPGESGSAMFTLNDQQPVIWAIHTTGLSGPYNRAVRIRPAVFADLQAWQQQYP